MEPSGSRYVDGVEDSEITNDESGLLTEQSSVQTESDSIIHIGEDENKIPNNNEMKMKNLPGLPTSRNEGNTNGTGAKQYLKRLISDTNENDNVDDDEDIFEKKKKPKNHLFSVFDMEKYSYMNDKPSTSKSELKNKRKSRRTRKSRRPVVEKKTNPSFDRIQGKQNEKFIKEEDRFIDSSNGEEGVPDSPASISTIDSEDTVPTFSSSSLHFVKDKKPHRHITINFESEEAVPKPEIEHHKFHIAGIDVKFPVKPYPSQIAVMNKLIQGCKKEEHCLLESPTGSGKTLALLCGVLAWQDHLQDEFRKQSTTIQLKHENFETRSYRNQDPAESDVLPTNSTETDEQPPNCKGKKINHDDVIEISDNEEQHPASNKVCPSTSSAAGSNCQADFEEKLANVADEIEGLFDGNTLPRKPPTIYYGSRTHRQIGQVVRELKKTAYSCKRMTILSSREFTCLHRTDDNKTEMCARLLDPVKGAGCSFYNETNRGRISSNRALIRCGIKGPWDIEDLVGVGLQQSACPYFAARDLMTEAEIVFCPYNYLVDPNIRQSMQINLDGQVVILDEAHNVEDMSREVGSLSFREDKILEIIQEAGTLITSRSYGVHPYEIVRNYLQSFLQFMKLNDLNPVDKFRDTRNSDFWTGGQLCELFNIHSIGKSVAKTFEAAAAVLIMDYNEAKEETARNPNSKSIEPVIGVMTKKFLEDLLLALQVMTSEKLAADYRACITESNVRDFSKLPDNTWSSRGDTRCLRTLQMLCMNPAVIFAPLARMARSIILASGTLTPITSFQSELDTIFPHKLDANHVVPKENVYIRGIPCGPTGVQLKANYLNVNSWNFQDELGRLILGVCKVIPHGVLCFFSSYNMMQKQIDRWRQNSCLEELNKVKFVLQEPRGSSNLEPVMREFRDIIQSTSNNERTDGITGALLLAVFRGKIAEGIDFSDNEARCVMAIGIPYAVRKDPSVDMKYNYNDLHYSKGLLKGGEWYAVQAFRALNQALGRCVRHRNDWGAVLLIDQRFLEKSSYNYLPKWVKTMWRNSPRYHLIEELQHFVESQVKRSEKEKFENAGLGLEL